MLTVTATDPSGNSASAAVTITFDAIAPAVFEEVHAHLEAVALVAGALAATEASLSWCAGTPLCTTFVR